MREEIRELSKSELVTGLNENSNRREILSSCINDPAAKTGLCLLAFAAAGLASRGRSVKSIPASLDSTLCNLPSKIPQEIAGEVCARLNGNCVSRDFYNKLWPAARFAEVALNADGKQTVEKVAKYRDMLKNQLTDMPSYKEYLNGELLSYPNGDPQNFVAKVALDCLAAKNPQALSLNALSEELRAYGNKKLSDPVVLKSISEKVHSAHKIFFPRSE